ncbi:hypothetical protein CCR75_003673 [Bremia lactucae]|uniref:Uncharacterized protein n=1 Tax=Bremia lactucae TaxID=4779 RepID=A0A976IIP7_BRELC|nr:hypothetical protein CCR75_003673 [Bremia lactucae]
MLQSLDNGRRTMILIANYRDSTSSANGATAKASCLLPHVSGDRCSETLRSIFLNAVAPNNLKISIHDQIYPAENERSCVDVFCELVGEKDCHRAQIVSSQIDAANATGPTAARYETEKAIMDEDFCMTIDSHLMFVPNWDEKIIAQWDSLGNPNAIITVYPKDMHLMSIYDVDEFLHLMCVSRIETNETDSMVQYDGPKLIKKKNTPKPRLMSQLAEGFNFGECKQLKEVRSDPYTPFLFHGEEYSRAARLWTAGYDFYVPSDDIAYHWYEKRKVVWERDWKERYVIQQISRRRIRHILGLSVSKEDFDRTNLAMFTLGTKRTFEQWKNFSGIDPSAEFIAHNASQFDNCRELQYVSY